MSEFKQSSSSSKNSKLSSSSSVNSTSTTTTTSTTSSSSTTTFRPYEEELKYIKQLSPYHYEIAPGFVPNMKCPGTFYVNDKLKDLIFEELQAACQCCRPSSNAGDTCVFSGGFLPAMKQIANVASLPGIVKSSIGLPDAHSGYGFAIGNVAAFDMEDPEAIVSPGGVGFDINCGVRLLRTNLTIDDVNPRKEELLQSLYDHIPVGVGTKGVVPVNSKDLDEILELGMDWAVREGYAWPEDKEHCEEFGRILQARADCVSSRAKKRGAPQLGTLGAGNHYCELQVVEEIYDPIAAKTMGINKVSTFSSFFFLIFSLSL